ncbi:hypothetical protein QQZ08_008172 [Neonectria magnoliae]|uniref:Uncharacterized protein n=1 Tax=Neonectria magnoliae TaxID=2732573 RepID=A0ABR1HXQ2_9HYPO
MLYPFKESTLAKLREVVKDLKENLLPTRILFNIDISICGFGNLTSQIAAFFVETSTSLTAIGTKVETLGSAYDFEHLTSLHKWLSPLFDTFEKKQTDIFDLNCRQDGHRSDCEALNSFRTGSPAGKEVFGAQDNATGVGKTVLSNKFLDQLTALPAKARLLIASRDLPAIGNELSMASSLEISASTQAILAFLLARMHIDKLASISNLGKLKRRPETLPQGHEGLDMAYDDIIARILAQDELDVTFAKDIVTWLFYAKRLLAVEELQYALATKLAAEEDPDATTLDEDFLPDADTIVSICAGIVTIH